jgi:hypothetical protein
MVNSKMFVGAARTPEQSAAEEEFSDKWMEFVLLAEELNLTIGMLVFWHNPVPEQAKTPFVATINPAVEEDPQALEVLLDHTEDMITMIRSKHRN